LHRNHDFAVDGLCVRLCAAANIGTIDLLRLARRPELALGLVLHFLRFDLSSFGDGSLFDRILALDMFGSPIGLARTMWASL
jgi:hypothetical protein